MTRVYSGFTCEVSETRKGGSEFSRHRWLVFVIIFPGMDRLLVPIVGGLKIKKNVGGLYFYLLLRKERNVHVVFPDASSNKTYIFEFKS